MVRGVILAALQPAPWRSVAVGKGLAHDGNSMIERREQVKMDSWVVTKLTLPRSGRKC